MDIGYLKPTAPANTELQKLKQSAEKLNGANTRTDGTNSENADKLSISNEARSLHHTEQVVQAELKMMPDVRQDRVEAAKNRLQNGFYSSDENLPEITDALLNQFSKAARKPEESAAEVLLNMSDELPEIRPGQVEQALQRKDDNFYNGDEQIRKTSENLWIPPLERI